MLCGNLIDSEISEFDSGACRQLYDRLFSSVFRNFIQIYHCCVFCLMSLFNFVEMANVVGMLTFKKTEKKTPDTLGMMEILVWRS